MQKTPKSMRLQLGLFGRTNVGKSSLLNVFAGQDVAITSPQAGTTTDVVEKAMELLPLGPVVFLDTAGLGDETELGALRMQRTAAIFDRADIALLVLEANQWGDEEEQVLAKAKKRQCPCIAVISKCDLVEPASDWLDQIKERVGHVVTGSATANRDRFLGQLKETLITVCPEDFLRPPAIVGDLLPPGGLAVLIVPIDLQAPKGRLILPQVQTIRDLLDTDTAALVVKEREYASMLQRLNPRPDIAICDSQVVLKMVADTPPEMLCTTFSILFARFKGDLIGYARGAATLKNLRPGDKVLIAEACSHHDAEDDIGRVKIPRWLRQYVGGDLDIEVYAGRDYPEDLSEYKVVIHCGGCMLTRRETLARMEKARNAGVAITNYGICISALQGVLDRALSPFPAALQAYRAELS